MKEKKNGKLIFGVVIVIILALQSPVRMGVYHFLLRMMSQHKQEWNKGLRKRLSMNPKISLKNTRRNRAYFGWT